MSLRLAGIAMLIIACTAAGCIASAGLKRQAADMRRIRSMIEKIRLMIRYEAVEVTEIAARLAEDRSLSELAFLRQLSDECSGCLDGGETFANCWHRAAENCGFSGDAAELLFSLGEILGSCDCEGQLSALSLAAVRADRLIERADEDYKAKGRLYRSLGAVAGALIAVIVI